MKYFEEAKHLWKTYVPKQGQSETIQGELIRAIEKLRDEAQRNGNGNWDDCFNMFCDFLELNLCNSGVFNMLQKMKIRSNIKRLRKFSDPYLEDDIYDDLTDRVVEWYFKNQEPIFKPYDPKQYR
ncbi:hypothetical protein HZF08_03145 [Paenibacillus sp. CGMCC 1.16610]|uniref:Uncharacterized protein n=1 Tax=Paenibacillus anseongense TaxID=2682845 RepID=A0ABW9UAC0_9BACL|nr:MULTISPECIES: hypothetical protein [Paenibacillus]MBA2937288.1 hypothetical protein [Paenibacillus sp. CGMCC 1.16610]MVQ36346.1 hypothetical protein [Paenibacillus anseongense]